MRPKYKIGETVFFKIMNEAGKAVQSFGCVSKIEISIVEEGTQITYYSDTLSFQEEAILGKAIIQKPRVRRSRSRKAMDDLKQMNGQIHESA